MLDIVSFANEKSIVNKGPTAKLGYLSFYYHVGGLEYQSHNGTESALHGDQGADE